MVVYAKSYPRNQPETLKEHTENLLKEYSRLKQLYGLQIESLLTHNEQIYFWQSLELCCKCHDLGKIYTSFQNKIRKALKMEFLKEDVEYDIPHNILSGAFLHKMVEEFPKEIQNSIYQTVVFHHSRGIENIKDDSWWKKVTDVVRLDLIPNLNRLDDLQLNFFKKIDSVKSNFRVKLLTKINKENEKFYILLKGCLHRIDHSASAHLEVEAAPFKDSHISIDDYLSSKSIKSSDIWQKHLAINNSQKNIILQANTGSGKTEFALYWIGDSKAFYTLPVRTSVNAMYERLKETYQSKNIGLLHSDNYFYATEEYFSIVGIKDQDFEGLHQSLLQMDLARQLSMPITVTTADQIFTAVFKYRGYEKIYATLSYSSLIVDEIQSYDPDMVAIILKGLEDITKLGGKFCLITATLPNIYIDYLKENIPSLEILPPRFGKYKRHRIELLNNGVTDLEIINLIKKLHQKYNKVLIIVNTIKKSQELYDILYKQKLPISLLHSGFIFKDRRELESGNKGILKNQNGIWITTQLAEVSLDIDFPVMITELSTIDSQVQRWGRVCRHMKEDYNVDEPNIYICCDASGIEDKSGRSLVYDKDIVRLSKETIKPYNSILLTQEEEYRIIQKVFGHSTFKATSYYRKFNNSLNLIKNLNYTVETKKEAQSLFRKIASVNVIPLPVYQINFDQINNAVKILSESGIKEERLKALYDIKKFSLSLPSYKTKNITLKTIPNTDIRIACIDYDSHKGIGNIENLGGVFI